MTKTAASTNEMVHLDELAAKGFDGFPVRKDLVRKYSRPYTMAALCDQLPAHAPAQLQPRQHQQFQELHHPAFDPGVNLNRLLTNPAVG